MSDRTYDENDDGVGERKKSYKYNQSELRDRLALPGRETAPRETSNICGGILGSTSRGTVPGVVR